MMENIIYSTLFLFVLFPLVYIFYKKGNNKFLFISSVIGASTVIEILLGIIIIPASIIFVFVVPSLESMGYANNIGPFMSLSYFIQKYYIFCTSVFHVLLSFLIYKRYELFQENT